jgi:hypothetical protein
MKQSETASKSCVGYFETFCNFVEGICANVHVHSGIACMRAVYLTCDVPITMPIQATWGDWKYRYFNEIIYPLADETCQK